MSVIKVHDLQAKRSDSALKQLTVEKVVELNPNLEKTSGFADIEKYQPLQSDKTLLENVTILKTIGN